MIASRVDRDVGEHLWLEQAILVLDGGANQQPPRGRIDRGRDIVDARLEGAAGQGQHRVVDLLADADIRRLALAHEGGEPDRGEIADDEYGIAGAGREELAG